MSFYDSKQALEFQQTLEIENVWPEKVQYSVVSIQIYSKATESDPTHGTSQMDS